MDEGQASVGAQSAPHHAPASAAKQKPEPGLLLVLLGASNVPVADTTANRRKRKRVGRPPRPTFGCRVALQRHRDDTGAGRTIRR
jgi:hypothetical protein